MAIILQQIRGIADSKWNGISGACYKLIGLDIHSTPGITKVQQKLTKESGSTVDELVKVAVAVSTGESFWFSSSSGKIWRRSSSGTWLLVFTTTAAAGEVKCLGAMEYNGYLYWATQSRLHRISMATAHATAQNWTDNAVLNWATFAVTDSEYHPMAQQNLKLFIGDGYRIASVDDTGTFDGTTELDLNIQYRISCLIDYDIDLIIGTIVNVEVAKARIFRWDCESPSWNTSDPVEEGGINAFIHDDNYLYVQAGRKGAIYYYDGEKLQAFQMITGDYSSTATNIIYPGSVATFQRRPIFGLSNVSGNPAECGIYQFGSYSRNYPKVLDLSWPISTGSLTTPIIGAVLVVNSGSDILCAWNDGTAYGVDKLDSTAKYASAYLETMMVAQDKRNEQKTEKQVSVLYAARPTDTGFVISYDVNNSGTFTALTMVNDTAISQEYGKLTIPSIGSVRFKVAFTVATNSSPEMEALDLDIA